jgi:uncharacterized membrane protein
MPPRHSKLWFSIAGLASLFGAMFSAFSTLDFTAHLDRQVHNLHCSFIPGMTSETMADSAGCRAVMNSPYSSFFRDTYWGGIPLALLSLAVFVYLACWVFDMGLRGRLSHKSETGYLWLASCLPLLMSLVYFSIAMFEVNALCKLCTGVYLSSFALFIAAWQMHREATATFDPKASQRRVVYFLEGVAFVVLAVVAYVSVVPSFDDKVVACGELKKPEDKQHALIDVKGAGAKGAILEVVDPLCPACKAFDTRVEAEGFADGRSRQVLLFPLDDECNWMLKQSLHPGACMVSRALICAGNDYDRMWHFVLDNQEEFRITATKAPDIVKQKLLNAFPSVAGCIDRDETKARLNNMLRFAMQNNMPIVTPQLYVSNKRLCDEDTDLGLNYAFKALTASKR